MTTALVLQHTCNALAAAREMPHAERTREVNLTITKLEEACLWLHANQVLSDAGVTRPMGRPPPSPNQPNHAPEPVTPSPPGAGVTKS